MITELLVKEHRAIQEELRQFEAVLRKFDEPRIRETMRFFDEQVILHRRKEEEALFPALVPYLGLEGGPVACMLAEHQDEKNKLRIISSALQKPMAAGTKKEILTAGDYIFSLLNAHIMKEDNILFPYAESILSTQEKNQVAEKMDQIGYCIPVP